MENMKFKKENVYIFKNVNGVKSKKLIEARTFIYNNHKFNLQGNSKAGYFISDNATGVLITLWFEKFNEFYEQEKHLKNFLENWLNNKIYFELLEEFKKCDNIEVEA